MKQQQVLTKSFSLASSDSSKDYKFNFSIDQRNAGLAALVIEISSDVSETCTISFSNIFGEMIDTAKKIKTNFSVTSTKKTYSFFLPDYKSYNQLANGLVINIAKAGSAVVSGKIRVVIV